MKIFRKMLFWAHLTAGITVAGVVIVMAATGVLLTYQKQITTWADRRLASIAPGEARLPVDSLLARITGERARPTTLLLRSDPTAPVEVAFGRDHRELVNPYTGALLGDGSASTREFFRVVTSLHRTLGASGENRDLGRLFTGVANFAFLFLVTSGFYLWWPRNLSWRAVRNVIAFRRGLRGKASDFNWHHVIGFWSLVPLFLIALSGVVISYRWAGNLVYRLAGEEPVTRAAVRSAPMTAGEVEPAAGSVVDLESIVRLAAQRAPEWNTFSVAVPKPGDETVTVSVDEGTGGQPQLRSTLVVDRLSGEVVRWDRFAGQSPGRRLRSILRFAHTGEILGVPGQTIAGLVSLGSVILAWTGVALAIRRLRAWAVRRRRRLPTEQPEAVEQVEVVA